MNINIYIYTYIWIHIHGTSLCAKCLPLGWWMVIHAAGILIICTMVCPTLCCWKVWEQEPRFSGTVSNSQASMCEFGNSRCWLAFRAGLIAVWQIFYTICSILSVLLHGSIWSTRGLARKFAQTNVAASLFTAHRSKTRALWQRGLSPVQSKLSFAPCGLSVFTSQQRALGNLKNHKTENTNYCIISIHIMHTDIYYIFLLLLTRWLGLLHSISAVILTCSKVRRFSRNSWESGDDVDLDSVAYGFMASQAGDHASRVLSGCNLRQSMADRCGSRAFWEALFTGLEVGVFDQAHRIGEEDREMMRKGCSEAYEAWKVGWRYVRFLELCVCVGGNGGQKLLGRCSWNHGTRSEWSLEISRVCLLHLALTAATPTSLPFCGDFQLHS